MASQRPGWIPLALRNTVRETVGGWGLYKVAEIVDLFRAEGFDPNADFIDTGSQRRDACERYQTAIDFTDTQQVERYLRVVERILDDHDKPDEIEKRGRLLRELDRADISIDGRGRLHLPARRGRVEAYDLATESGIRFGLARLDRLDQEPEELIGAAKELVEATAKHVLTELGEPIPPNADVAALSKKALALLNIHPQAIAPEQKGAAAMVRMLGALGQVAGGLAELRNLGYGTGHGQSERIRGIKTRHAEFAARAASTYVAFVLDTLHDPDAPWRSAPKV